MRQVTEDEVKRPVVERRGLTIYIDGEPGPMLNAPIATRPQDWTPRQAAIIWGEAELRRRERLT